MKEVPAHIERVILEKAELDDKIHALRKFIGTEKYAALAIDGQGLLSQQLWPMQQYSDILGQRLAQFWCPSSGPVLGAPVEHHPV